MKFLSCSLFLLIYIQCINAKCSNPKIDSINVKTVLWRVTDTYKICWSKTEELLLYSRRAAQDLLPKKIPKDLSQTIHYLEIIWEAIEKFSPKLSNSKEILRPAIADVIGGYLQTVALPMVNEGYYAGDVDYAVIKSFYDLFHRVKGYLDTDGRGWHRPCDMRKIPTRVSSFDYKEIPSMSDRFACEEMHVPQQTEVEETIKNSSDCGIVSLPIMKKNELSTKLSLPFLDDENQPSSVVIPFRDQYLYSLTSASSAHILARYYNLGMRCIGKSDQETMLSFNHAFYNWIVAYVAPHLHTSINCHMETEWYSAFGSVMRILETMHQNGLTPGESRGRDYGIMQSGSNSQRHRCGGAGYHGFGKAITDIETGEGSGRFRVKGFFAKIKRLRSLLVEKIRSDPILPLIALIVFLILFFCCLMFCCLGNNKRTGPSGKRKKPIISFYYKYLEMLGVKKKSDFGSTPEADQFPDNYSRPSATVNSDRVDSISTSMMDGTTTTTPNDDSFQSNVDSESNRRKRKRSPRKERKGRIKNNKSKNDGKSSLCCKSKKRKRTGD